MSDMLPCPFCGGEAEIKKDYDTNCFGDVRVDIRTVCAVCGAAPYLETVCGTNDNPRQLREKIVTMELRLKEKWNKRNKEP